MKTEYTKGPWEIRYLSGIDMEIVSNEGSICKFNGYSHSIELMNENEEKERANAQLIAAAPLLLKALESMSLSMCAHPDCTEGSEFEDMVSTAEEAIKKARG
jgi:hypothetical protein